MRHNEDDDEHEYDRGEGGGRDVVFDFFENLNIRYLLHYNCDA